MQLIKVVLPTSRVMIKIFICGAARGWPRLFGFMTWQMSTITLKILITLSKTAFFSRGAKLLYFTVHRTRATNEPSH